MDANLNVPHTGALDHSAVAERLDSLARELELSAANPYRVRAYRVAAETLRQLDATEFARLVEQGPAALQSLPGIGTRLSATIEQLARTGHSEHLDSALAEPLSRLATVPGIGRGLARLLHDRHGIATLYDLETAAYDGRLSGTPGFGPKRLRGIRETLAARLRGVRSAPEAELPPVADVLALDALYRARAGEGLLRTVAPNRFNPTRASWLPILAEKLNGRRYRALYSNSPLAHRLGRIRDWVVIHYWRGPARGQCTVVTETRGPLRGKRVIRGREVECARFFDTQQPTLFDLAA